MADKKSPKGQQAEGMMDKAKGKAKEAAGAITNDNKKRADSPRWPSCGGEAPANPRWPHRHSAT